MGCLSAARRRNSPAEISLSASAAGGPMRVAILFDNLGPYHLARLRAASQVCRLLAIQVHGRSREYSWKSGEAEEAFRQETLEGTQPSACSKGYLVRRLNRVLGKFRPDCVFIPGWSNRVSLAALGWCQRQAIPAVIMSESTEHDVARLRAKEWIKSQIIEMCSAGIVGGTPHVAYLTKLGMDPERIFTGYDVVDNEHFALGAREGRRHAFELRARLGLPENYFLASARFISRKNLPHLIEQYVLYRKIVNAGNEAGLGHARRCWSLVLLGDGVERPGLESMISRLRLKDVVLLPGFKQYEELPAYYALAGAFVHCSTSEPWGLVVNEAMASGLPVLVSERCGCAQDLVRIDRNGYTFAPRGGRELAELLVRVSNDEFPAAEFGRAGQQLIDDWKPKRFAGAVLAAAKTALAHQVPNSSLWQKLVLQSLITS